MNRVSFTLSWGEPFNNFDPIISYTLSCRSVSCYTTPDNTTRKYTITNFSPMITYQFSVVATNSFGSGDAGVLNYTIPSEVKYTHIQCIRMGS